LSAPQRLSDNDLTRAAIRHGARGGVAPGVCDTLRAYYERYTMAVRIEAEKMCQYAGRTLVTEEDVALAVDLVERRLGDLRDSRSLPLAPLASDMNAVTTPVDESMW